MSVKPKLEQYKPTQLKVTTQFFIAPNEIFDLELNPYELSVYFYLLRCGNNSIAFPSYKTISIKTGMSKRKAIDVVSSLVDKGILIKHIRKELQNMNESNVYEPITTNLKNIIMLRHSEQTTLVNDMQNNMYNIHHGGEGKTPPLVNITHPINNYNKELYIKDLYSINEFFNRIWNLYPNKKGKSKITDNQKIILFSLGENKIINAINLYIKTKEKWRTYLDGSTFFNQGYLDYIDNYTQDNEIKNINKSFKRKDL